MELVEAVNVTDRLSRELLARRPQIDTWLNYYRGKTGGLKYASSKFKSYFEMQFNGFADNWCAPVADATTERLKYQGFRLFGKDTGSDTELERLWELNDGHRQLAEAFTVFSVTGRAYAMVAPPTSAFGHPRLDFLSPENTIIDHDPETRQRRYMLVMWSDDRIDYATLYSPDWVWKFKRDSAMERHEKAASSAGGARPELTGGWTPRVVAGEETPARNPMGVVPGVELRNRTLLDDQPLSDIEGVTAMQDSVNLVWAYLLNGLDAASLPQRVVTNAAPPHVPILDKNGKVTGTRPADLDDLRKEALLWIPGDGATPAQIAEWSAANLAPFGKVIEDAVSHIASQTKTPPHYLMAKMVNTAADALTISEAGLVSKVGARITLLSPEIREINRLMAIAKGDGLDRINGIAAGKSLWADIQYRSEAQMADAMLKLRQTGFPFGYIAERYGLSPDDIRRVEVMRQAELAMDPLAAAQQAMQLQN